eukprot:TRINITY_DN68040_c4_g1_i8.p1 TRINITY_DN68040_c4_g1~~TRINITY_DN68040_c4_g1_i8.p1  ORF type:complete len:182 (-),score=11.90 TRINITY_DN68040_c4_g1_i8:188-733(-)
MCEISGLELSFPSLSDVNDAELEKIKSICDTVYQQTEGDMFKTVPPYERILLPDLKSLVEAQNLVIAYQNKEPVGCVRITTDPEDATKGLIGLLAVDPAKQGVGIGRELMDLAEATIKKRGQTSSVVHLLYPIGRTHAFKDHLESWYTKMGFVYSHSTQKYNPPFVNCACEMKVYVKPLGN